MMARAFGARSIAVVGASSERLAIAAKLGADMMVNVQEETAAAAFSRVGSELPSVVIEATGNPKSIVDAVNTTAPGGRVVAMGIFAGQLLNGLNLDRIVVGEISLKGALGSPGVWPDVIRLIESQRIDPSVLVTDALQLDDYHQAISRVKQRSGVKNIVRPK
jgi:threonine dehydrogenase-like Zn-dependent dehydrogenase